MANVHHVRQDSLVKSNGKPVILNGQNLLALVIYPNLMCLWFKLFPHKKVGTLVFKQRMV